jgi:hypothetical protein
VEQQPVRPAAGTNRRRPVFGSVEALGRSAILQSRADAAGFGRDLILVFATGSCRTGQVSQAALAE